MGAFSFSDWTLAAFHFLVSLRRYRYAAEKVCYLPACPMLWASPWESADIRRPAALEEREEGQRWSVGQVT